MKRVRSLLKYVEDRASGSVKLTQDGKNTFKLLEQGVRNGGHDNAGGRGGGSRATGGPRHEEIQVRATGRAIFRALQLAVRLQQEMIWRVRFETVSVGAVDDIVERRRSKQKSQNDKKDDESNEQKEMEHAEESMDVEGGVGNEEDVDRERQASKKQEQEEMDVKQSRIRLVNCFIIYVGLR